MQIFVVFQRKPNNLNQIKLTNSWKNVLIQVSQLTKLSKRVSWQFFGLTIFMLVYIFPLVKHVVNFWLIVREYWNKWLVTWPCFLERPRPLESFALSLWFQMTHCVSAPPQTSQILILYGVILLGMRIQCILFIIIFILLFFYYLFYL